MKNDWLDTAGLTAALVCAAIYFTGTGMGANLAKAIADTAGYGAL